MRIQTKSQREGLRAYQFNYLIEQGYARETYKTLDFFTREDGKYFTLKVYRGTSTNHEEYKNYRTAESRCEVIQNYKDNYERRAIYKAEQKAKGQTSCHAGAAAGIREELKKAFPSIKFSIRSESFANGNSVNISWTDGPTNKEVESFTGKYQMGHFNGMDDIYEYSNSREDVPQVKYISCHRSQSEAVKALLPEFNTRFSEEYQNDYRNNPEQILYRIFNLASFPAEYTNLRIERTDTTCGHIEEFYQIVFDSETKHSTAKEPTEYKAVEVVAGEINIVDYSEKAFAVIGDTKPIKDKLKELGGSFNPRLSCGAGWIFSKKKLEEVQNALTAPKVAEKVEQETPEVLAPPAPQETAILPTPKTNLFQLEYFKIIWHEGYHIEGATFENTTFTNWEDIQKTFVKLWEVNERGNDGGYTKVKCEMKFIDQEVIINRIDITNKIKNGDFNPSDEHIVSYLQGVANEEETTEEQPPMFETLPDITEAAESGKVISLYNLSQLVNA